MPFIFHFAHIKILLSLMALIYTTKMHREFNRNLYQSTTCNFVTKPQLEHVPSSR